MKKVLAVNLVISLLCLNNGLAGADSSKEDSSEENYNHDSTPSILTREEVQSGEDNDDDGYARDNTPLIYTPAFGWVNDPNGLVYVNGLYHLFYQYNPDSNQVGNISWGHAVSTDLIYWQDKGTALRYKEDSGRKQLIFSGSAVYDVNNTSGFGTDNRPPIVAFYTEFNDYTANGCTSCLDQNSQSQSIAYSTDNGDTWTLYENNPVIEKPPEPYQQEYQNFRDPKVFWYAPHDKWVMVVVISVIKKAALYSSKDLKSWEFMSEFSSPFTPDAIWECPDLFELPVQNSRPKNSLKKWVLVISTNPGGVSGGSGMHYHIGDFDGYKFTEDDTYNTTQWLDYGSDYYAGVTWNNLDRRIMIAWIDNWNYGPRIYKSWKGGLGHTRELGLARINGAVKLTQRPVENLKKYRRQPRRYVLQGVRNGIEINQNQAYELVVELRGHDKTSSFVLQDNEGRIQAEIQYNERRRTLSVEKISNDPSDNGKYVRHTYPDFYPERREELRIFIDDNTLALYNKRGDIVFTELLISNAPVRTFFMSFGCRPEAVITRYLLSFS